MERLRQDVLEGPDLGDNCNNIRSRKHTCIVHINDALDPWNCICTRLVVPRHACEKARREG